MIRTMLSLAIAFLIAGCVAPREEPEPGLEAIASDGRDIAEAQCAACHAVGAYGDSPNPAAPQFRTILSRYRADVLEEELIAGIQVAHPMPTFQFNPQGADALISYLRSVQEPPSQERHPETPRVTGNVDEGRRLAETNCSTCLPLGRLARVGIRWRRPFGPYRKTIR
ncbi:MAG: cytochrome c [Phycisphaerales bacterium]|nr:cytochrome c [Hyphomonadaceae bacterium]